MKKVWNMYQILDERLSYQNRGLEYRDAYRLIVYIKSAMRGRLKPKEMASGSPLFGSESAASESLLYGLVMSLRSNGVRAVGKKEPDEACLDRLVIDGQGIQVGWNSIDGVYILAETKEGNALVEEIACLLENENIWWNQCSG
ncbi:MAG TPA: hypothetical protein DF613_10390 [Lachnospiraceae bacterium]|nr:hypothetical protein [Lachnospiraceae bacterium]